MEDSISLDCVYIPSEDIVARKIENELIIVPLTTGIGDLDEDLYSLNETGKDIWFRLDGQHTLRQITAELAMLYETELAIIETDLIGLISELAKRKIVRVK